MTTANKITITRILLIPVFVMFAVYYGESVRAGHPQESLRAAAIAVFLAAALSDGIDGFLARRFNQRSRLGEILDPIADKGLLITTILTLTFTDWKYTFPAWFPVLVIGRDLVILTGAAVLQFVNGHLEVRPSLLGKAATALQMSAIAWIMFQLPNPFWVVAAAGAATLLSGFGYVADAIRQLHIGGHGNPRT